MISASKIGIILITFLKEILTLSLPNMDVQYDKHFLNHFLEVFTLSYNILFSLKQGFSEDSSVL